MKTALFTAALIIFFAIPADAHKVKRNCLWAGNNIFRAHIMCSDGNSQPRATPSHSVAPSPPDRPDCKDDDDKEHGKSKGRDKED